MFDGETEGADAPPELRALQALARANQTLALARPYAGAADEWGRERDGATVPQSPAPSRAAPAPSPAPSAADEDAQPVRMGVMVKILQDVIRDERTRSAQIIADLERRIEALEARSSKKGKANGAR